MRRKIVIICCVFAFLTLLCAAEYVFVSGITREALKHTREILADIEEQVFVQAKEKAHALDQAWDRKAVVLEVLVNHSSTDEVRYALSRLLAAIESEDTAAALIYCSELEGSIEHVCERQMLTLENIL